MKITLVHTCEDWILAKLSPKSRISKVGRPLWSVLTLTTESKRSNGLQTVLLASYGPTSVQGPWLVPSGLEFTTYPAVSSIAGSTQTMDCSRIWLTVFCCRAVYWCFWLVPSLKHGELLKPAIAN